MAIFRVNKTSDYTVMSNHHLRNETLSLRAKGLFSVMLSLPADWDFTIAGLSKITNESIDIIRKTVLEIEAAGYIKRTRVRNENGQMGEIIYDLYEAPILEKPILEKPILEKPILENPTQIITNKLNTDLLNTDLLNTKEKENIKEKEDGGKSVFERIVLKDGTEHAVTIAELAGWQNSYPRVDVEQSIRSAAAWCRANPAKRKTEKGIARFLNAWLSRDAERVKPKGGKNDDNRPVPDYGIVYD